MVKSNISLLYFLVWSLKSGSTFTFVILLFLFPRFSLIPFLIVFLGGSINLIAYVQLQRACENSVATNGLFGIVRHPMYLGELVLGIGMAFTLFSLLGILVLITQLVGIVLLVLLEEQVVTSSGSSDLEVWYKSTQRLLPWIW